MHMAATRLAVTPDSVLGIHSGTSDCPCIDGHGTGVTAKFVPRAKGKCLAHETLTLLKQLTTPAVFRKITWTNGAKLLKRSA